MDSNIESQIIKASKEYAAGLPAHIKKLFPKPDVEIVKLASGVAGMEILHACYILATEEAKNPQDAHDWFIASLKDLFTKVEESYQKIGIHAHFEIMTKRLDDLGEERNGGDFDWSNGRRWS